MQPTKARPPHVTQERGSGRSRGSSGSRSSDRPERAIGPFRLTRKPACHFRTSLQICLSIGQLLFAPPPQGGANWAPLEPGLAGSRGSRGACPAVTWCVLFPYHVAAAQMPALLPVASCLLLLPRALLSMASGSPPPQPSTASGSSYVPGSVSAAFVTCPNEKVAKEIARAVVEKRLAACVNLIPQITSIYEWKGKIEEDSEVLMMIKTRSSLVPALTDFVRSVHPYEVAEVIALPVEQGNFPYLHWVHQVTESSL